jgi:1-acyl-sn-glycerol-3-phosphate acyltransferase
MDQSGPAWRPSRLWRALLVLARLACTLVCRLRVSGDVDIALRRGACILAVNHIGTFDPIVFTAACRTRRLTPRIMASGGLFRTPVVGTLLRWCGLLRVDRGRRTVAEALPAATRALAEGSMIAAYPEGRISLDPGLWPERGKTGVARLALASGAPVVPVAQWGAHEVIAWGGWVATPRSLGRALVRRPVVRVHFGRPVDLSGLRPGVPADVRRATDRIIEALIENLAPLRVDEPDLPRHIDPTRPVSTARSYRPHRGADGADPVHPAALG